MKTTINFPKGLTETQYNSTIVSALITLITISVMVIISYNVIDFDTKPTLSAIVTALLILSIVTSGILSLSLKQQVLESSGSPLICKEILFNDSVYNQVTEAAKDGRWSEIEYIAKSSEGTAMRLELVYSKDKTFAAYQLFKYVPYCFEPCSDIVYIEKGSISNINMSKI